MEITYNTFTIALCPGRLSSYDSQKGKSVLSFNTEHIAGYP